MNKFMKPIPEQFTSQHFSHTLIRRAGMIAIFERFKRKTKTTPQQPVHFEVVIIRPVSEKKIRDQKPTPAHEAYPGPGEWGSRGWTLQNKGGAELKMEALLAELEQGKIDLRMNEQALLMERNQQDLHSPEMKRLENVIRGLRDRIRVLSGEEAV